MDARNRIVAVLKFMLDRARNRPVLAGLVGLLVGLLAVFGAVMASGAPEWAYGLFGAEEKFRVLEFLGVAMGGVLLAIGATIAHKRAVALERAAEAQAGAAQAQAAANKGAEDGRRQERLKNAIEHLGHASDSVRLGGAYELFHLAQDTEDLRQTVMDILCAHIRRTTGEDEYREKHKVKPSEEVQSLLTLLFVQKHEIFKGCHVNLQASWLNGADLRVARLQGTNLSEARLRRATLIMANLQEATLSGVHLQSAALILARMQGAKLPRAQLQGAWIPRAYVQGADFYKAHLQATDLFGARLQGAGFYGACVQGAQLSETQLQGAQLSEAQLQGVTCRPAAGRFFQERIREGIGRESDLSEVTFSGGLNEGTVDCLVEDLSGEEAKTLRRSLEPHIGKPASHALPKDSGAIIGAYTEEEAERWIAEYEEVMGERPEAREG